MSTAASPSSDTDPSEATEVLVIRGASSSFTSINTSTRSPAKLTSETDPTSTPATRTGAPGFSPATLGKMVLIG